ncbi:MAG: enhanced serine sensitivity protein SseB C-terminal domain-containing protein [Saprospiraceae bacterium]
MEHVKPEDLSLEQLLEKASTEAAYRPEFYKRLLDEALVVITMDSHIEDGEHTLDEQSPVNIATFEDGKMPIFTSTDRIFDKGIVTEEVQILQLRGQSLFEMARGASFVLNPYSDFGKEMLPDEVERMLDGTIFSDGGHEITLKEETQVLMGQPANYPTVMVNSLCTLYAGKPNVNAAYLAWIDNPASGTSPHLIIGLDATGDFVSLSQETGFVAREVLGKDEIIDIIQVDDKGGISDYFINSTKAFYTRS